MKPKTTIRFLLTLVSSSLFTINHVFAETYYWDGNDGTVGFQDAAPGPAGTWSSSTPSTATGGFTTVATGATAISGNDPVTTTTADTVYIGTGGTDAATFPPPLYPFTGTITIDGTVDVGYLYQAHDTPTLLAINNGTINFADEGTFKSGNTSTMNLPTGVALTGASTSLTWKVGFSDNLSIQNIASNGAAKNIHQGPGRLVIKNTSQLGPINTPFVFDGGVLRINSGILWESFSDMNADHPITLRVNKDVGLDKRNNVAAGFTWDNDLDIGTGGLIVEGSAYDTIMNRDYLYHGRTLLMGGYLSVETAGNLGQPDADLIISGGTLKIRGTTLTSFSTIGHAVSFEDGRNVGLYIDEPNHSFTADAALNQGTGKLLVFGAGKVVVTETNTYTGNTELRGGTLIVNGDNSACTGLIDTLTTGSILGGTGTIGGDVNIKGGSGLTFDISTAPESHDKLDVLGTFTLASGSHELTITSSEETVPPGIYTLVTSVGAMTGTVPNTVILPVGWTANDPYIENNSLKIEITADGYATWMAVNAPNTGNDTDADEDGDGVANSVEYLLGGLISTNDLDKLPATAISGDDMTFTFVRDASSVDASTTAVIELSTSFDDWSTNFSVPDTDTGGVVNPGVTVVDNGDTHTVTLTIPKAPDTKKFARLKVTITL